MAACKAVFFSSSKGKSQPTPLTTNSNTFNKSPLLDASNSSLSGSAIFSGDKNNFCSYLALIHFSLAVLYEQVNFRGISKDITYHNFPLVFSKD